MIITVVRVHKPSSFPTDYIFSFHAGGLSSMLLWIWKNIKHIFVLSLIFMFACQYFLEKGAMVYHKKCSENFETLRKGSRNPCWHDIYLPHNLINIIHIKEARKTKPNLKFHIKAATPQIVAFTKFFFCFWTNRSNFRVEAEVYMIQMWSKLIHSRLR